MTDPYNSYPSNLSPPTVGQADATQFVRNSLKPIETIAKLDVSEKWKERFRAIDKAGGPELKEFGQLSFSERRLITSNWLAFLFWPIYLPMKGLWKQALSYFVIGFGCVLVMELIGLGMFGRAVGYGIGAMAMMRANVGYYKKTLLNETPWL